jgi:hypothetical protein
MSNYVGWPVQLLELQLAYFVLGVTLTVDSGPGFNHMHSCYYSTDAFSITPFFVLAYRSALVYLLIASAMLTKHSPIFTCVCTDCALVCI